MSINPKIINWIRAEYAIFLIKIALIEELNLNGKAILVTSCFEDIAIRNRCENIGVKIIPKSYVPYIKIIETPVKELVNTVVFIDDDEIVERRDI